MSADDLRHRAQPAVVGGVGEFGTVGGPPAGEFASVAARVPDEYRDAYLEGFARVRADRDDTAA